MPNWNKRWKNILKITHEIYRHVAADKVAIVDKYAGSMLCKNPKAIIFHSLIFVIFSIVAFGSSTAMAANKGGTFMVALRSTTSPPGALNLCGKYRWACTNTGHHRMKSSTALNLAKSVNNKINRQVRQIEDIAQYGRKEYWTLPTARGGDCEDIVLLKKKKLLEKGLASEDLLIATVLDLNRNSHAVLVLRTQQGDYVLDSLRNRIIPWRSTGYTFLKMQNPKALGRWDAILAGGLIKDQPTGSN